MTSTNQTSSSDVANLVSSSPELLTRPASKLGDRSISSTGELCTFRMSRRREPAQAGACIGCGDESHFLSARANRKYPNHFRASKRTDLHFTTLQTIRRSGCSACSAYRYKKSRNRVAAGKDSVFRKVEALSQHFCNLQAVDFAGFSRCLQITQNLSNADVQAETSSEIVVRKADKNLRQTENSQLELRIFRVYQPLTSKISENKKFLRQPTHTTIVDCHASGQIDYRPTNSCLLVVRSGCSAYHFRTGAVSRFHTPSVFMCVYKHKINIAINRHNALPTKNLEKNKQDRRKFLKKINTHRLDANRARRWPECANGRGRLQLRPH
jgi:hypothetical protein